MKQKIILSLGSIVLLSGCETLQTPQQRQQAQARQQAASRHADEQMHRLRGQLESVEMENARLMQEMQQLRSEVNAYNSEIAKLNSSMQSLEAKQAREMQALIKEVEALLKKSVAPRPPPSSSRGPGREHEVQAGHTLSAIAEAYGTTVKAIRVAEDRLLPRLEVLFWDHLE